MATYPRDGWTLMTAMVGGVPVDPQPESFDDREPPAGHYGLPVRSPSGGEIRCWFPPVASDLESLRSVKIREIEARAAVELTGGFAHDFGSAQAEFEDGTEGDAGPQVLQTRDADDDRSWLVLDGLCTKLLMGGLGTTEVPIRAESNAIITVTAAEASSILTAMAQWGAAIKANAWALKNAARRAETAEDLGTVDVDSGWPS